MPDTAAAFRVEHYKRAVQPDGRFAPAARLVLLPNFRRSGLLAALPGEEVKTLITLLTFLTANGRIEPTLAQVAEGLGVPEKQAQERLLKLMTFDWRGLGPLVREAPRGEGAQAPEVYRPAPYLVAQADEPDPAPDPPPVPGSGEAVVAASRAAYARPREEVEKEILATLGRAGEQGDSPEAQARRTLGAYGLTPEQAGDLVARFGAERVLKQAAWMPLRGARNPAAFLAAAVERDYGAPPGWLMARGERRGMAAALGTDLETDGGMDEEADRAEAAGPPAEDPEPDAGSGGPETAGPDLPPADLTVPPAG